MRPNPLDLNMGSVPVALHAVGLAVVLAALTLPTTLRAQAPAQRETTAIYFGAFVTNPLTDVRLDSDSDTDYDYIGRYVYLTLTQHI